MTRPIVPRPIAQTLARVTLFLDEHPAAEQEQAMAFLNARYPGRAADALSALEERRRGDRDRQARHRGVSRDESQAECHVTPTPLVATPAVKSFPKTEKLSRQEQLDKARKLLEPGDLEFLMACPDPYQGQWLGDGEWWISLRDGYPKLNAPQQASRYMAWPGSQRKRDHRSALRNWFAKADRWREGDEMRKAVRR